MKTILLADDHPLFREGLKLLLDSSAELKVVAEAGDGTQVMQLLSQQMVDLVILDISMPGRSGIEVLEDLHRLYPDLPVLMVSMHPEEQYAVRAFRAGAAGYVPKGGAPEELRTAVHSVLGGMKYISASVAQQLVRHLERGDDEGPPHERLTEREQQVLVGLAGGRSVKEIGAELALSPKTISTYRARLLEKLGMRTNAELTRYAVQYKLLQ